jgi:uncharacterized membrane protein
MSPHDGVPADTLAPLVVAFGAMLILGGVVWSPIASIVGLVLVVLGVARWIEDIWREASS